MSLSRIGILRHSSGSSRRSRLIASSFERQKGARRACATAKRLRSAWMRRISARDLGSLGAMTEPQAPGDHIDVSEAATEHREAHGKHHCNFVRHRIEALVERGVELARVVLVLGEPQAHLLHALEVARLAQSLLERKVARAGRGRGHIGGVAIEEEGAADQANEDDRCGEQRKARVLDGFHWTRYWTSFRMPMNRCRFS